MPTSIKVVEDFEWREHSDDTFLKLLGEVVERGRDGLIEIGLQTDERHKNLGGITHGGVIMTLIDRAIGLNCRMQAPGKKMVTASLTTHFVSAVFIGDFLTVTCILRKTGRRNIFADAEVRVNERLVATGTGLWVQVGGS